LPVIGDAWATKAHLYINCAGLRSLAKDLYREAIVAVARHADFFLYYHTGRHGDGFASTCLAEAYTCASRPPWGGVVCEGAVSDEFVLLCKSGNRKKIERREKASNR
jgi:hypothetical protein